jgi:GT2 family glycosyltransferase
MIQQLLDHSSKNTARVSVIVVTWNRRELMAECLQSLTNQTLPPVEVVVVDNGSTDGTVEMVEAWAGLPIRLIRNTENQGFCAANNQGFAVAQGEFFALLNNDAVADPRWLEELAAAFADHTPRVGMAASKILVYSQRDKIDKAGHLIYWDGQNRGRGTGETDAGQYDRIEEVLWPDGCAAMYRREMIAEIGGFDEEFFAYADDAELGLRARLAGWTCLYMPAARVFHHRGSTLGVYSSPRIELIERNRILLVWKLFPWSLVWLNGWFYLLRVSAGVIAAARGRGEAGKAPPGMASKLRLGMALIRGGLRSIPLLPSMLRKRSLFRPLRRLSNREVWRLLRRFRIPLRVLSEQSN